MKSLMTVPAALLVLFAAIAANADDLRFFRHDHGVSAKDDAPLPDKFDDSSQLAWRMPLAMGHSTPCVYGDALYLTTFDEGKLFTLALDRATGETRWKMPAPNGRLEPFHSTGSPAAATPACDGQRVYSFFGSFGLLCYDLKGNLVWSRELGPFQDEFGAASSPVLCDDKLLLAEDHDADSFLLCLDAASGKPLWHTPRQGLRSYSTPVIWQIGDDKRNRAVVVAGALALSAYDLETGTQLWSIDGLARIVNTTPAINGNRLYVASWSPGGDQGARIRMDAWPSAVKKWDANGDGKIARAETDNAEVLDRFFRIDTNQDKGIDEAEWNTYSRVFDRAKNQVLALETSDPRTTPAVAWTHDRGIPYVPSPLVYRDVLYLVKEGGIVTSLDPAGGKVHKQGRLPSGGNYYASPVAGDGKVYLLSEPGVLTVLRAGPKWETFATHDFDDRSMATPILDNGQLFIRTESSLYCFQKKP